MIYEQLLFSNIDDATGTMLSTIVKKGHRFMAAATGTYAVCLDNRMARFTAKVVTLEIDIKRAGGGGGSGSAAGGSGEASDVAVATMRNNAQRIHAKLMMVENAQVYHFHREQRHRDTAESTNTRVTFWTVVEALVVLSLTGVQIALIRMWVNKNAKSLPTSAGNRAGGSLGGGGGGASTGGGMLGSGAMAGFVGGISSGGGGAAKRFV